MLHLCKATHISQIKKAFGLASYGQNLPREGKSYLSCNCLIFVKNRIFSRNFGSRYARETIKGSKDADDSLVSNKKLSQKNGS